MTPKQFIEKALEGGYEEGKNWKLISANGYWVTWLNGNDDETTIDFKCYLLDAKIWQAVGKVEGWEGKENCNNCGDPWEEACWCDRNDLHAVPRYKHHMHRMIDALCEGKSIEKFLETL